MWFLLHRLNCVGALCTIRVSGVICEPNLTRALTKAQFQIRCQPINTCSIHHIVRFGISWRNPFACLSLCYRCKANYALIFYWSISAWASSALTCHSWILTLFPSTSEFSIALTCSCIGRTIFCAIYRLTSCSRIRITCHSKALTIIPITIISCFTWASRIWTWFWTWTLLITCVCSRSRWCGTTRSSTPFTPVWWVSWSFALSLVQKIFALGANSWSRVGLLYLSHKNYSKK